MSAVLDYDLLVPVSLRKKNLPAVTVYGDDSDKSLVRALWGFMAGADVQFLTPTSEEDLMTAATQSAMIFINISSVDDPKIKLAKILSHRHEVVADVIAITAEPDIRTRLHIMSQEFDGIYNREILELPEFARMFAYKLSKGMTRLKARLQEDEYKIFQSFLSASADAFIVFDKNKRIFFISDHYLSLYPKSAHLFVKGTPVQRAFEAVAREMGLQHHDPRYQAAKEFWLGLRGQYEFKLDNGMILRMTAVPLPNNQGTIVSTTDITELTKQKEQLASQQESLAQALTKEKEAGDLQRQFISMVSHEFRTPLTIVDGNAQIIERRFATIEKDEIFKRLHTIRSAVSRVVQMMEAVLSSNMLKSGKLDLYPEEFDLKKLIETLCEEQSDLAKDYKITCNVENLPDTVFMDRKILTLIVSNLLSNAVKYTKIDPHIVVEARSTTKEIYLSVKDNGIGIPENELDLIFDKFYRATTSNGVPGSGIGLSLVRDLVHLHNGEIKVSSKVGKGTHFEVRFLRKSGK